MPNQLDFLSALDDFTRASPLGYVASGGDLQTIAQARGLTAWADGATARWTGALVELGYVTHGPLSAGDRRPLPPGSMWNDSELQRVANFQVTAAGREEADRMRRRDRENRTDGILDRTIGTVGAARLSDAQRRALDQPLRTLQAALDGERHSEAVGAARDLVEAACKIAIASTGAEIPRQGNLVAVFKLAVAATDASPASDSDLARSLAATVQRLAELRNSVGAGHGHAALLEVSSRHARLAASLSSAVADFVLGTD